MGKKRNQPFVILIGSIALAATIIFISVLLFLYTQKPTDKKDINQSKNNNQKGSNESQPEIKQEDTNETNKSEQNNSQDIGQNVTVPTKPTLSMSSGNAAPVPTGVLINFLCMSSPDIECKIILNSQGKSPVVLDNKKVTDNGRGQYFAEWNWSSVAGEWAVTAEAKNQTGGVSRSETKNIVVK